MSKEEIIASAEAYVKAALQHDSSGHDWWHIYRVTRLAKEIARQEKADGFICELAALLHDIADEKLNVSKEAGLQKVSGWLENAGVGQADSRHILDIISAMSFGSGNGEAMPTLEGRIVQDADQLDALGAIGIARTFAYSGWKGQLLYDPDLPVREHFTKEQYRNEKSTAVNHFHEKLFKLKDLMNTGYARQLAEKRHQYMVEFMDEFSKEWEGR
jgi:uncharacterized protein